MRTLLLLTFSVGAAAIACDDDPGAPASTPDAGPIPDHALDSFDPYCRDPGWRAPDCVAGVGETHDLQGQAHIPDEEPISYALSPPSSGDHRGQWARWGEYTALPPQRWLHNLEHGGVALLYHPCAPAEMVEALRAVVADREEPELRYILTPYADLPAAVAVVAWRWRYLAPCVRPEEIHAFIDQHYNMATEDVPSHGGYSVGLVDR